MKNAAVSLFFVFVVAICGYFLGNHGVGAQTSCNPAVQVCR